MTSVEHMPHAYAVVSWRGWVEDPRVERAPTRDAAEDHVRKMPDDRTAHVVPIGYVDWPWDWLEGFAVKRLVELYVAFGGGQIPSGRFETRAAGAARVRQLIERLTHGAPVIGSAGEFEGLDNARELTIIPSVDDRELRDEMEELEQTETETETPRGRRPKVGDFRQARAGSRLGKIYAALEEHPRDLAGLARSLKIPRDEIDAALRAGRRTHGVDFSVDEADGSVALILPEDRETAVRAPASADGAAGPRRGPSSRETGKDPKPASEFSPVRPGTIRARIVALADGTRTEAEIARELGLTPGNTHAHVYCLWRDCGMGFRYRDGARVEVLLPEGVASAVKSEAVPAEAA